MKKITNLIFCVSLAFLVSCAGGTNMGTKEYNQGNVYIGDANSGAGDEQRTRNHDEEMFNMAVDAPWPVQYNGGSTFVGMSEEMILKLEQQKYAGQTDQNLGHAAAIAAYRGVPPYRPNYGPNMRGSLGGNMVNGSSVVHVPYQGEPAPPPLYR